MYVDKFLCELKIFINKNNMEKNIKKLFLCYYNNIKIYKNNDKVNIFYDDIDKLLNVI